MRDGLGRNIDYMRMSLTERCNLNCVYCRPQAGGAQMSDALPATAFIRAAKAAVSVGIRHFRLTGGEPLVRDDCVYIARELKRIEGVETVSITTNGLLLEGFAERLSEAGIDSVNVSLDTLDVSEWEKLTGSNSLGRVISGVRAARRAGITVRLNAVTREDTDPVSLALFAEREGCVLRFIEMMPIGRGAEHRSLCLDDIRARLNEDFGIPEPTNVSPGNGPARYMRYPRLAMPVGFIEAVHDRFCATCNRVRLTARGELKPCLCYSDSVDLAAYLLDDSYRDDLTRLMCEAIRKKPVAHCFDTPEAVTEKMNMSSIGG